MRRSGATMRNSPCAQQQRHRVGKKKWQARIFLESPHCFMPCVMGLTLQLCSFHSPQYMWGSLRAVSWRSWWICQTLHPYWITMCFFFYFFPQHSHICERVTQFCFLVYLYVTMRSSKYNIAISGYGVKGILNSASLLFKIQNNQMNGVSWRKAKSLVGLAFSMINLSKV